MVPLEKTTFKKCQSHSILPHKVFGLPNTASIATNFKELGEGTDKPKSRKKKVYDAEEECDYEALRLVEEGGRETALAAWKH